MLHKKNNAFKKGVDLIDCLARNPWIYALVTLVVTVIGMYRAVIELYQREGFWMAFLLFAAFYLTMKLATRLVKPWFDKRSVKRGLARNE